MERQLTLELVRVTEAAAISAARWMGRGEKESADGAAVDAMRAMFDTVSIRGTVVIGEGEKDEAPMLYIGEKVGSGIEGQDPDVDIAVDPVEGTNLVAKGLPGALAVLAVAPRGGLLHAPDMYMEKIAVGPGAVGCIDLNQDLEANLRRIAEALNKPLNHLTVVSLERDRNGSMIQTARGLGCRIRLISDGDVAAAMEAALTGTGIDVLVGIGGAPEGVLSAAALYCIGGDMQGRLWPRNDGERERARAMGVDPVEKILEMQDLVFGDDVMFVATGITGGEMLQGVRFTADGAETHSLAMRALTGTHRWVRATHQLERKPVLKDLKVGPELENQPG